MCGGFVGAEMLRPVQWIASEPIKDRQGLGSLWPLSRFENAFQPYLTPGTLRGVPSHSQNTLSHALSFMGTV